MKTHLLIIRLLFLTLLFVTSGNLLAQEPTTPPSNLSFSSIDGNRMRINFTSGDGAKHLIIAKEGSPVTAIPSDGIDYVASSTFGNGNELAPGEFVVYEGTSTGPFVNGLDHSTNYYFRIFEFNGSDSTTDYLTSSFLEGNQATLTNPTTQASNIIFSNVDGNSMTLNWTNGNGSRRLLIAKAGSPVDTEPQQLVSYNAWPGGMGNSFYEIGTDNYVLYDGSGSSTNLTNLQPGIDYHFALFEYNGSSGKVYLTSTSIPSIPGTTNSQTTATAPTENSTAMSFYSIDGNRIRMSFSSANYGNGARRLIVAKEGGPVMGVPVDGTDYNASSNFGDGDTLAADEYVVYNGAAGSGAWIFNLQPSTTYHVKVFEYNGTETNTFYLTGDDVNSNPVLEASQSTLSNPTTQASNITFSNVDGNSMTVNWDDGDGSGRILIAKAGSPVDVEPQDLISYNAWPGGIGNSFYEIGTENYVLYSSSGSSTTLSNLQPGVTYHFALFEYNGSSGRVYLTSSSTPNSAAPAIASQTTATAPTENSTAMSFYSIDGNRIRMSFSSANYGNGARRIIVAKEGSPVTGSPVDGVDYTADSTFGDGDTLGADEYVVYNGTGGSGAWIFNLQPSTTYHVKVFEYNGTGANTSYLTGIDVNSNPVLEASQSTLSNPTTQASNITFSNVDGNSMTVNWDNGDGSGRILIAKAGSPVDVEPQDLISYNAWPGGIGNSFYEIGTENYVLYSSSGSSTTLSNLQPGVNYHFALFEYNGSSGRVYLTSSSTPNSAAPAIASQTTATAPTENSTAMSFYSIDGNRIRMSFSSANYGNGARRIIVAKEGSPVTGSPVDGVDYTADSTFGDGDTLGADEYVVYNGTAGSGSWIFNLQPSTTYHVKVFEYNGTGVNTFYLTGDDVNSNPVLEASQSTLGSPTVNSTGVFFNSKTSTSFNLNWTNGDGAQRLLIIRENEPVNVQPQDLISYNATPGGFENSFYEIGTGNYAVYSGSGNSVNVTNLNPGTNYHFELFEYNGSNGKVYLRPGYTFQEQTFGTTPTVQVSNPLFSVVTSSSMVVDFDKGDGSHRLVLVKKDSPVDVSPTDLTSYNASNLFGNGDEIGTGNFVVFSGTGEEFQLTNLDPTSTYHFAFFEYALSSNGNLYLSPGLTASQTTSSLPCQVPNNLTVDNITNTSANVSWESEATALLGYDYVLNTDGAVPDGTTTPDGSVGTGVNTLDFNSLSPNTSYYIFVRSVCEVNNQSQWSNFVNFTTLCDDPVAVTQDFTVQLDANGQVTISPAQVDDGSLSNCGSSNLSLDISNFDCSNIGDNTVTLTITDLNNNTDSATAVVTVEDVTPPTVTTQNLTVQLDSDGQVNILPSDINNGSTDNCEIDSISLNVTTFGCEDLGTNIVTLTVTDVNGNSNTGNAIVTVEDVTPPTVVTQDITIQIGAGGSVSIDPSDVDNGSTDICGIDNLSLDISTFTTSDIGPNTVTLSVTDVDGNTASDIAIVTVQNTDLPVVVTQNITVPLDENGQVTIVPSDVDNGSTSSGSTSLSLDITSFDCSDVGPNTVTLTVSDGLGNSVSDTAIVTVIDQSFPVVVTQDLTLEIDENGQAFLTAGMVDNGSFDNCGIQSYSIDKTTFDCGDIGVIDVVLTVVDINGNSNNEVATITVEDQNPPNIWYADNDMDGFGDENDFIEQCSQPTGYVPQAGDCNDSDPELYPGAQYFEFTGNTGFVDTVVNPTSGAPTDTYTFEVNYFDVNNEMPPFGFPRAIVDFNSDNNFTGPNDRTVILSPLDPTDTNLTDGKTYVGSITPLEAHLNYQVIIQSVTQGCETTFGPFDAPDVLEQPDVEIFASDISFSEDNPAVNSSITVSAEVHNASDLPAEDFFVSLVNQFDNTVYTDVFVDYIAPQSSVTVDWTITTPLVDAFVPMQVIIDKTNLIAESNELDNTAVRPFINGDFNVPGSIDVVQSVSPPSGFTYSKFNISGTATYSDLAVELENPVVMGAEVSIFVPELGQTFIGNTNNTGTFNIKIPLGDYIAPGLYNYEGTVTDFTLTSEQFTGQFTVSPGPLDLRAQVVFSPNKILDDGISTSTVFINVENISSQDAPATNLSISQTAGFTAIPGNVNIPPLLAGESHTISFSNLSFSGVGFYSVSVQADSDDILAEANEFDNFASANLEVLEPKPDLVYLSGPSGNLFFCQNNGNDISFRIRNVGNVPTANNFSTEIQVFKDGTLENTYIVVFNGSISVNGTGTISIPNVYNDLGNYGFVLNIDTLSEIDELSEVNNTGSGSKNVVECKPELSVSLCHDGLIVNPIDPLDGANVTYNALIRNTGLIATPNNFVVRFQVDGPGGVTNNDQTVTNSIGANSFSVISINAPLAPQDSELIVVADVNDSIDETIETNNTSNSIKLCHEFRLTPPQTTNGNQFWQDDTFFQFENVVPNIRLKASNAYTASEVDVKFEVSGPGILGTIDLGTVAINDVNQCDMPIDGYNVVLPTSFSFNELGTYTFTFTVDPDNEYLECDDTNNVFTREVEVESLADMQTLSEFINPSILNPEVNETVTLNITYENIGFQNVSDEMDLKIFVNEVEIATVENVPGLLNGDNNTVTVPVPFQSNIPGANVVKVFIDADDEIIELREDNNEATRVIIVGDASNLYFEDLLAVNTMANNLVQLEAIVGNDGILDTEAELRFTYQTPSGNEIFIGQMPIQLDANSTESYFMNWTANNPNAIIKAEIINSTIPEFNELDNIITLQNRVDFSLDNPNPLNLVASGGDNVNIFVDVNASFTTIPFAVSNVQLSAYLSSDCEFDVDTNQLLGTTTVDFAVDQSIITSSINANLPAVVNNNSRIIWVVDSNEQFEESNETNNELCITVNSDNLVAPTVVTQNIVVELDEYGTASIVADDIDNGSTDDVTLTEDLIKSLDITFFNCSNIGENTVTLTVTDANGNSSSDTATVTIVDNLNPSALAQDITVTLNAVGQASISASSIDNGSSDNCSIASRMLDITSFDCSNLGTNTVTLTVIDANGNIDTAMATVTVVDNISPNAVAQDITVSLGINGTVTIEASQIESDSSDNCEIVSYSLDQTTFDSSDIGDNTVILTVTDSSGNTDTDTATVTIVDNDSSIDVVTQNITIQLDTNGQASITPAMIDNGSTAEAGIASLSVDITDFDCTNLGQNTVTLAVTDLNGDSDTATAIVTVEDNIAPTAVVQNITVLLDANGEANISPTDIDNDSFDNCNIENYTLDITDFNCSHIGDNTVILTVTDTNGNSDSATAIVKVEDDVAPTVLTQNITVQLDASGNASITPNMIDEGSFDNCEFVSYSLDVSNFTSGNLGSNTITLTVTDQSGNSSSATAIVTVIEMSTTTFAYQEMFTSPTAALSSSIAFHDVDDDNDPDIIITGATQRNQFGPSGGQISRLYRNDGYGNLSLVNGTPFMGLSYSSLSFVDLNLDGILDVISAGEDYTTGINHVKYYANDGTGNFSVTTGTPFPPNIERMDFKIADFDNDGVNDVLFIGISPNGSPIIPRLFENQGTEANPSYFNRFNPSPLPRVSKGSIAVADVDGDNKLDIFLSGKLMNGSKHSELYRNDGNFQFSQIMSTTFDHVDSGDSAFADVDDDGDQDLLISGLDSNDNNVLKLYLNDGSGNFTEAVNAIGIPSDWLLEAFDFADVDGDGDQDVLLTGYNPSNFSRITTLWENLLYSPVIQKCKNSTSLEINFEEENLNFGYGFKVIPNPTGLGYANILMPNVEGEVEVSVSDVFGRIISTRNETVNSSRIRINTQDLSSGIYVISLKKGKSAFTTKLIVD